MAQTIDFEDSTRSAAVIRMLVPLILLSKLGHELLLFKVMWDPLLLSATVTFFVSCFTTMLGVASRVSATTLALSMSYFFLYRGLYLDVDEFRRVQQYWALAVCLPLTDCGKSLSVDRWRAVARAERIGRPPPPERGALTGLRLLALQVSLIYLWGAFDKTDAQFLAGERIDRLWMARYGGSDYPAWPGFRPVCIAAAWAVVLLEWSLGVGLWFGKSRRWLAPIGVLMHAAFYVTLPIGPFSLMMWTGYIAFIPPYTFDAWLDRMLGRSPSSASRSAAGSVIHVSSPCGATGTSIPPTLP